MKLLTKLSQQLKLLIAIVDIFLTFSAHIGSQPLSSVASPSHGEDGSCA